MFFYKKPTANKFVTHRNSALSMKNKVTILSQECFRRMHNTSESVNIVTKAEILSDFMADLKLSGYNEKERYNILIAGLNTYSNLKELQEKQQRPLYRSGLYKLKESKSSKQNKIRNWFKNDKGKTKFTSVIFVEATPDDKLLRMLKEKEHNYQIDNFRFKFVPKSGIKLRDILQRKDPFESDIKCDCVPSNADQNKISKCRRKRVCYSDKCKECDLNGIEKVYHG